MFSAAIDTSTPRASVAIAENGKLLLARDHVAENGHGAGLMSLLDAAFAELKLAPAQITRWAVGIGPGSFTGTRIGVSVVKGIALARAVEVVGVDAFDAVERGISDVDGSALLAKRGELFVRARGEVTFLPIAHAAAWFRERGVNVLAGEGTALIAAELMGVRCVTTGHHAIPTASAILEIALTREAQSASSLEPFYARPPDITKPKPRSA